MAGPSPVLTLEVLIQKSTSPLNVEDDPNSIQAVCQAVNTEAGGVQTAVRLLAHKIQSPQERESLQALAVLQACVNNCGQAFHSEIGKFRFLNEMIKLVSPKYLGNHTHASVKSRVVELLYTWTLDLKSEPKIYEAYNMLKKQGVVKEDPSYLGAPTAPEPRQRPNAVFEDEEKSRLLQKLLQSKNPHDLHKANALIKSMVKEDERRMERTSRRVVEVETAVNNVRVLDEMLSRHQESPASQADLDLMMELHGSCSSLRANLYRLVSEMDDKEEGIGDLLKANDELSRVMGRYKLIVEGSKAESQNRGLGNHQEKQPTSQRSGSDITQKDGEILLDLSTPEDEPSSQDPSVLSKDLQEIGLGSIDLKAMAASETSAAASGNESSSSLLEDLGGIFPESSTSSSTLPLGYAFHTTMAPTLVPQLSPQTQAQNDETKSMASREKSDPLEDLAALGSSLIKQHLPPNTPVQVQFKPAEKLSMNQMKQQQQHHNTSPGPASASSGVLLSSGAGGSGGSVGVGGESSSDSGGGGGGGESMGALLGIDLLSEDLKSATVCDNKTTTKTDYPVDLLDDSSSSSLLGIVSPNNSTNSHNEESPPSKTEAEDNSKKKLSEESKPPAAPIVEETKRRTSSSSNPQFMEVKPMTDLKVTLDSIKPGKQGSVMVVDSNDILVMLHFTENQPRDDVSVVVVSTISHNSTPISNYVLQAVVPKGCKVRLQPPSSTELAPYSPFLPPPAITQIMLIANPNKLNVSLKVMLSYTLDDDPVTEMGEVDSLPL